MGRTTTVLALVFLAQAAPAQTWRWDAWHPYAHYGASVAVIEDVDGDGLRDVLIGAPSWDPLCILPGYGGYAEARGGVSGAEHFVTGSSPPVHRGVVLAAVPDFDLDGVDDFAVGEVPDACWGTPSRVLLFSGQTLTQVGSLDAPGWVPYEWDEPVGDNTLDGLPDVNGDGRGELVIGASLASAPGMSEQGQVCVWTTTGLELWCMSGTADGERFGKYIEVVGDWGGSPAPDIAIGNQPTLGSNPRTLVVDGLTGTPLWTFPASGDLGLAPDADGDGLDDLFIGPLLVSRGTQSVLRSFSPWEMVRATRDLDLDGQRDFFAVDGSQGRVAFLSGSTGSSMKTVLEGQPDWDLGVSFEAAGDLDRDSFEDFIIGAPRCQLSGNQGSVFMFSSREIRLPETYCQAGVNSTGQMGRISSRDSWSVSHNQLTLLADGLPDASLALFLYGSTEVFVPWASGFLCVGPTPLRVEENSVSSGGSVAHMLDLQLPQYLSGPGVISAGDTVNFQLWYRDTIAAGGANLTDALRVVFTP